MRTAANRHAFALADLALSEGVLAFVVDHRSHGWSVWASTPFHAGRVLLKDRWDVKWLAAELHAA